MKDHVEIGHLTKYDAFRMNRDQVMDLEIRFKILTNVFYISQNFIMARFAAFERSKLHQTFMTASISP